MTSVLTPIFYVQGLIEGDDIDDDVPITIDVFVAGTTNPSGYEQTDRPSAVDVGPSGFSFGSYGSNAILDTTTFSPDENIEVESFLLYDSESGTLHNYRDRQSVRGGHTVTIDPTNSNPTVGVVVSPAVFTGGSDTETLVFDGLVAGTTILDIVHPAGHTELANRYPTLTINVDAPDLTLERRTSTWIPSPDENIGRDLQVERRIGLEVAPPAPGVDVTIEVVDPTVALISTDPTAPGNASITFPLVTGTFTPLVYVQGLTLNQGTELRITAPGYDQWITTVQVVDSGFYISMSRRLHDYGRRVQPHHPGPGRLSRRPAAGRRDPTGAGRAESGGRRSVVRPGGGGDHRQPVGVHRHRRLPHHRVRPARRGHDNDLDHPTGGLPAACWQDIDRGDRRLRVVPIPIRRVPGPERGAGGGRLLGELVAVDRITEPPATTPVPTPVRRPRRGASVRRGCRCPR